MTVIRRNSLVVLFCGVVMSASGCQTASLEDAAPTRAQLAAGSAAVQSDKTAAAAAEAEATTDATPKPAPTIVTQMGLPTVVPSARPKPETKDFVATGARRTGDFPQFKPLESANSQLSPEQKKAAEKEMADLLRARAATPAAQMTYAERLAYLRKLAATHADEAEAQIAK